MTRVYYKRRATVNRVFVDGQELFNVTVIINDGEPTVTENPVSSGGGGATTNSGGGPGEEPPPKK